MSAPKEQDWKGLDSDHAGASSVVFFGLVLYLIVDRAVPDLYVLPVGFSLKIYHVAAAFVALLFLWSMAVEVRPFPQGITGLLGLLTLAVTSLAPFINAPTLTAFEADGAERGVMTIMLMAGLFVSSYYLGQRGMNPLKIITVVIVLTSIQAGVAVWERWTGLLVTRDASFLDFGFLVPDPGLEREFWFGSNRIGGGGRPVATAPHPIVLSALIALAILLIFSVRPYLNKLHRRQLFVLLLPLAGGLFALETRTGFVILGVAGLAALGIVAWRKTNDTLALLLVGGLLFTGVVAVLPSTARTVLNQFSGIASDPSIAGRLSDVAIIPEFVAERPLLGPGFMTHNPELVIFDNSYYEGLVEFGVIGFGILLTFLGMVTVKPLSVLSRASDGDTPILIVGFSAGLSLLTGMALFDATKFAQFLPTVVILVAMGLGRSDAIVRVTGSHQARFGPIPAFIPRAIGRSVPEVWRYPPTPGLAEIRRAIAASVAPREPEPEVREPVEAESWAPVPERQQVMPELRRIVRRVRVTHSRRARSHLRGEGANDLVMEPVELGIEEGQTAAEQAMRPARLGMARAARFEPNDLKGPSIKVGAVVLAALVLGGFGYSIYVLAGGTGYEPEVFVRDQTTTPPLRPSTTSAVVTTPPIPTTLFETDPAELRARWNLLAEASRPELVLIGEITSPLLVNLTPFIALEGVFDSTTGYLSLRSTPTGTTEGDRTILTSLGIMIAISDPTLKPADRRLLLEALGLDIRNPQLGGINASLNYNGLSYRMTYLQDENVLEFVISPEATS